MVGKVRCHHPFVGHVERLTEAWCIAEKKVIGRLVVQAGCCARMSSMAFVWR